MTRRLLESLLGVVAGPDRMGGERIEAMVALGERCEGMPLRDVGGECDRIASEGTTIRRGGQA